MSLGRRHITRGAQTRPIHHANHSQFNFKKGLKSLNCERPLQEKKSNLCQQPPPPPQKCYAAAAAGFENANHAPKAIFEFNLFSLAETALFPFPQHPSLSHTHIHTLRELCKVLAIEL
jgi:hypothetical protein